MGMEATNPLLWIIQDLSNPVMNKVLGKRMLTMEPGKQNAFSAATFLSNSDICRVNTVLFDHFLKIWDF